MLNGFCKNQNKQRSLLIILELQKEVLYKGKSTGAIFMDLYKVFDTQDHDLLIAKLEPYGFFESSLNYFQSYWDNRLGRKIVNNNFSLWKDISTGVPQGFLCPLVFNILIILINILVTFLFTDNACLSNYAGDATLESQH